LNHIFIQNIQKPATTKHSGDNVYLKSPNFIVTLKKDASVNGVQDVKLKISYQGCSEQGLCYEPSSKIFNLKIDTSKLSANTAKSVEKTAEKNVKSETDSIADTIKSSSFLVVLATFFGFGVLLSLTPCVFPMIPIISGVIISQGEGLTTRKAFAIMGFLSALIVGPCVAAPLAGALVYIGQTGDALLGGAALFSMSIGMGIPLILVGVSAGKFMPKPGAWMTMVNEIFGALMLGVAVWMLEKVLPSSVTVLMFAMLGIGFSVHFGAFDKEGHSFKRGVFLIIFIYSLALFVSFLAGEPSISRPLGFLKAQPTYSAVSTVPKKLKFTKVTSLDELNALLQKNKGKKIMLDFAADWCTACKELEEVTFADPRVRKKLSDYVLIRADVTKNTQKEKALSKAYGVFGPPAMIFFDKNLKPKKSKTIIGFVEPDDFLAHLNDL